MRVVRPVNYQEKRCISNQSDCVQDCVNQPSPAFLFYVETEQYHREGRIDNQYLRLCFDALHRLYALKIGTGVGAQWYGHGQSAATVTVISDDILSVDNAELSAFL